MTDMSRARILIISTGPLCRNPRVFKEASTLGAGGYDVTVLTFTDAGPFEAYDRELLVNAPFRKIAISLHPDSPLARFSLTAQKGVTWSARKLVRFGVESPSALGLAWLLGRRARSIPADLTIVHTELPFCLAAELLTQGRRVAADFEDWHSRDLLPADRRHRPIRLLMDVESQVLQKCAYTSTTSHAMAAGLHAAYGGSRPVVLSNSFPLPPPPPPRPAGCVPAFFWYSQTIGPGRGIEEFIAAWIQTTRPSRLCLLGQITEDYRHSLLGLLPAAWHDRLQLLPFVSPAELTGCIARHDLGLALEPAEPDNKNLTISNKIFQYFSAGLGVLASDTAGQREALARAPGAGLIVPLSRTRELANLLDSLIADPACIATMGAAARRAAETTYCWEMDEPRLLAAVATALQSPSPGK